MEYVIGNTAVSLVRESLSCEEVVPLLEAFLFTQDKKVPIKKLNELTGYSELELWQAIKQLKEQLDSKTRGLAITVDDGMVQLRPKKKYELELNELRRKNYDELTAIIDEFLIVMDSRGRSERTIDNYNYKLRDFLRIVLKPVAEIKENDIRAYLMHEKKKGNQNSTIKNKISVLKSFFNWLELEEHIPKNPMRKIERPKVKPSSPKFLTPEEIEMIREINVKLIDRVLFEVIYSSGIRASEASNLDWNDIDFAERILYVRNGKGNKDRVTFLSVLAVMLLKKYKETRKDNNPWVFQSNFKKRISRYSINRHMNNLGEKACLNKKLTTHKLRHSFATHLLRKGMAREMVQRLLGHSDPKTTDIYAKVNIDNIKHYYRQIFY